MSSPAARSADLSPKKVFAFRKSVKEAEREKDDAEAVFVEAGRLLALAPTARDRVADAAAAGKAFKAASRHYEKLRAEFEVIEEQYYSAEVEKEKLAKKTGSAKKKAVPPSASPFDLAAFRSWQTEVEDSIKVLEKSVGVPGSSVAGSGYLVMSTKTMATLSTSLGAIAFMVVNEGVTMRNQDNLTVEGVDSKLSNTHLPDMRKNLFAYRMLATRLWYFASVNGKGIFLEFETLEKLIGRSLASVTQISMAPPGTEHIWRFYELAGTKIARVDVGSSQKRTFLRTFFEEGFSMDTTNDSAITLLSVLTVEGIDEKTETPVVFITRLLRSILRFLEIVCGEVSDIRWEEVFMPFERRLVEESRLKFACVDYLFDALTNVFCQWSMIIGNDMPKEPFNGEYYACTKATSRFYLLDRLAAISAHPEAIQDWEVRKARGLSVALLPRLGRQVSGSVKEELEQKLSVPRDNKGVTLTPGGGGTVDTGTTREKDSWQKGMFSAQICSAFVVEELEGIPQEMWKHAGQPCQRLHTLKEVWGSSPEEKAKVLRTLRTYYAGSDREEVLARAAADV